MSCSLIVIFALADFFTAVIAIVNPNFDCLVYAFLDGSLYLLLLKINQPY
jgi:hypothetical protein